MGLKEGMRVRVVNGPHKGKQGYVTLIGDIFTYIRDDNGREFIVRIADCNLPLPWSMPYNNDYVQMRNLDPDDI